MNTAGTLTHSNVLHKYNNIIIHKNCFQDYKTVEPRALHVQPWDSSLSPEVKIICLYYNMIFYRVGLSFAIIYSLHKHIGTMTIVYMHMTHVVYVHVCTQCVDMDMGLLLTECYQKPCRTQSFQYSVDTH